MLKYHQSIGKLPGNAEIMAIGESSEGSVVVALTNVLAPIGRVGVVGPKLRIALIDDGSGISEYAGWHQPLFGGFKNVYLVLKDATYLKVPGWNTFSVRNDRVPADPTSA